MQFLQAVAVFTPHIFDPRDGAYTFLTSQHLFQIILPSPQKLQFPQGTYYQILPLLVQLLPQVSSPISEKFSNWLTSTVPHIPIIFPGDLNSYIDYQDHTLAYFLTSSLLASLSTIHSHICTLDFVIYTNYTTSKISVPSTLARPWLSIFPNHSLHYLLSRNSSIQNGFSLILPFSTNTPLLNSFGLYSIT